MGMWSDAVTVEGSMVVPQKKKKLKIRLPCDSAILLLGTNPKEDICTPMFIVALFIKAKK